ncbi:MAG: primosomal protein N' [Rhodospirillaceae bacterium]|jgi:primosomal protein N' (replication factor Y)
MVSSQNSSSPLPERLEGDRISVLLPLPLSGPYDYRIADNSTLTPGEFIRVPLGRREAIGIVWGPGTGEVPDSKLRPIIGRLQAPCVPESVLKFIEWVARYTVHPLGAVLKMVMSVPAALEPPKPIIAYAVNETDVSIRLTPSRRRVLEAVQSLPPLPARDLAREAGVGVSVVKGLAEMGALKTVEIQPAITVDLPDGARPGPALSPAQSAAAEDLIAKTAAPDFSVTLLNGVPGSGKTEVYFEAVAEALKHGKQALVLLPEIALSAQWLERFRDRFGGAPAEWHSELTPATRRQTWRAIAEGKSRVVVGARSALFLPFPELGIIVIDEEHDGAFKQDDGVTYNARDMAVVRAQLTNIPVVLASATPSLETVVNVQRGRYGEHLLTDRHGNASLPDMKLIDMRAEKLPSTRWLSDPLIQAVEAAHQRGEQSLLFLNRRGYAPLTLCRTCGHRWQCPRCTAWLVEHRQGERLQCHHCDFSVKRPSQCPECEAEDTMAACGPGVERLAEEVKAAFPEIRFALASSDTLQGPRAAAELVRQIEERELDLIIGTQVIAKGYHFPMLTTVGVIDADLGLAGGDLRAAERTYQLLYQVAGRAGREDRPGQVILQTYNPDHPVMQALVSGSRRQFLDTEISAREGTGMPPFGRLVALIVSGRDVQAVERVALNLRRSAPHGDGVTVLGPAPAAFALLRGRHRRRLLLKARRDTNVQKLVYQWLERVHVPQKVRVQVDVDPYSFL